VLNLRARSAAHAHATSGSELETLTVLRDHIVPGVRAAWHARVGELAEAAGEAYAAGEPVAFHFLASGQSDRAIQAAHTALGVVRASRREGSTAFDELWETVAEIVESEPPLYLAGGYATVRDFLAQEVGEPERSAKRWMKVAKYASPVEENKYGTSKLDAAIAFVEAKNGAPAKGRIPIDFAKLKVLVEGNGKRSLVKLADATVDQIRAHASSGEGRSRRAHQTP
jgi:hypothetical protein